jgi:hypothetical protein
MGFGTTAVAMTMRLAGAAAAATALACAAPAAAQGKVTPLFAENAPLEIVIDGPIGEIVREAERSTDPHPATLTANGESHAIELSARGISRRKRENCRFPPLSIDFAAKPAETSLFDGQNKLKLVAHCRDSDQFEQLVLKEYVAYRLYNRLTDESLKVRLARIRYTDDGKEVAYRWGFLIEDVDDAAKRVGMKETEVLGLTSAALDPADAGRYVVFQYLLGNTDWDMSRGPQEGDCCHNSKLIGATKEARNGLTPVPYDFDNAGLVDAPYAVPVEFLKIDSVRERKYRGLCMHSAGARAAVADFVAARPGFEAELAAVPGMNDRTRGSVRSYLASFFEDVSTPEKIERNLIKDCR